MSLMKIIALFMFLALPLINTTLGKSKINGKQMIHPKKLLAEWKRIRISND